MPPPPHHRHSGRGAKVLQTLLWCVAVGLSFWAFLDLASGASDPTRSYKSRVSRAVLSRVEGGGHDHGVHRGEAASAAAPAAAPAAAAPVAPPVALKAVAIIVLCRESEAGDMAKTMASFDGAYNAKHRHDYVVFTDEPWSAGAMATLTGATASRVRFALLTAAEWGMPSWVDRRNFSHVLSTAGYYGNTESYRKMCRFFAGPVFTTEVLREYEFAWRLDSHVRYLCDIVDDPIARMRGSSAVYGFAMRMKEKMDTIPSLWPTLEAYAAEKGLAAHARDQWDVTIPGANMDSGCHYWNNFEITRLSFFRGARYQDLFSYLDHAGGFFYERWGDAPVRSWALILLADKRDVVWFEEVGYQHPWWFKCPPPSAVCFRKGVALPPGPDDKGTGCVPDPEVQPATHTDGKMCAIGT